MVLSGSFFAHHHTPFHVLTPRLSHRRLHTHTGYIPVPFTHGLHTYLHFGHILPLVPHFTTAACAPPLDTTAAFLVYPLRVCAHTVTAGAAADTHTLHSHGFYTVHLVALRCLLPLRTLHTFRISFVGSSGFSAVTGLPLADDAHTPLRTFAFGTPAATPTHFVLLVSPDGLDVSCRFAHGLRLVTTHLVSAAVPPAGFTPGFRFFTFISTLGSPHTFSLFWFPRAVPPLATGFTFYRLHTFPYVYAV